MISFACIYFFPCWLHLPAGIYFSVLYFIFEDQFAIVLVKEIFFSSLRSMIIFLSSFPSLESRLYLFQFYLILRFNFLYTTLSTQLTFEVREIQRAFLYNSSYLSVLCRQTILFYLNKNGAVVNSFGLKLKKKKGFFYFTNTQISKKKNVGIKLKTNHN